jgi:hypothetical protein
LRTPASRKNSCGSWRLKRRRGAMTKCWCARRRTSDSAGRFHVHRGTLSHQKPLFLKSRDWKAAGRSWRRGLPAGSRSESVSPFDTQRPGRRRRSRRTSRVPERRCRGAVAGRCGARVDARKSPRRPSGQPWRDCDYANASRPSSRRDDRELCSVMFAFVFGIPLSVASLLTGALLGVGTRGECSCIRG